MMKRTLIATALALPLTAGTAHAIAPAVAAIIAGTTVGAVASDAERRRDAEFAPEVVYGPVVHQPMPAPAIVTTDPRTGATIVHEPVAYVPVTPVPYADPARMPSATPSVPGEQVGAMGEPAATESGISGR
jgi:hypothetical protein